MPLPLACRKTVSFRAGAHYVALRAGLRPVALCTALRGWTGVGISWIFEHLPAKIGRFPAYLGDCHISGALRSESAIPMIASGNHTTMYCGLVRNDI